MEEAWSSKSLANLQASADQTWTTCGTAKFELAASNVIAVLPHSCQNKRLATNALSEALNWNLGGANQSNVSLVCGTRSLPNGFTSINNN